MAEREGLFAANAAHPFGAVVASRRRSLPISRNAVRSACWTRVEQGSKIRTPILK